MPTEIGEVAGRRGPISCCCPPVFRQMLMTAMERDALRQLMTGTVSWLSMIDRQLPLQRSRWRNHLKMVNMRCSN